MQSSQTQTKPNGKYPSKLLGMVYYLNPSEVHICPPPPHIIERIPGPQNRTDGDCS